MEKSKKTFKSVTCSRKDSTPEPIDQMNPSEKLEPKPAMVEETINSSAPKPTTQVYASGNLIKRISFAMKNFNYLFNSLGLSFFHGTCSLIKVEKNKMWKTKSVFYIWIRHHDHFCIFPAESHLKKDDMNFEQLLLIIIRLNDKTRRRNKLGMIFKKSCFL